MQNFQHYTLTYALTPNLKKLAVLIKKNGPKFLQGKITVPGGKVEPGESIPFACQREFKEETGVEIEEFYWNWFDTIEGDDFKVDKFYALSPDVLNVRQVEEEPVFVMDIDNLYSVSQSDWEKVKDLYVYDFLTDIRLIKELIDLRSPGKIIV